MLAPEVAKKYAGGLFLSVKGKGLVNTAYDQLVDLRTFLESDPALLDFLVAPHVLEEHKLALVEDVFSSRLERLFVELLFVLVKKHRIGFLHGIIDEFVRYVEAEKGIGRVTVISALALSDTERSSLIARMAVRTGLKIELEEKVDPGLIGGMIVITHDEIIDGSIRRELDLLKIQLTKVRVH
jgi:F-type H+-transporting ATPase subunit delta